MVAVRMGDGGLLKTPIIGRLTAPVASSCIDIEAIQRATAVDRSPAAAEPAGGTAPIGK
jgi:hypothetical protein